jgi:hypothetical protein
MTEQNDFFELIPPQIVIGTGAMLAVLLAACVLG